MSNLDVARNKLHWIKSRLENLGGILSGINGREKYRQKPKDGKIDASYASDEIRKLRSYIDELADIVFAINREQNDSDLEIQKLQMLATKKREKEEAEKLAAIEAAKLKPDPFTLD